MTIINAKVKQVFMLTLALIMSISMSTVLAAGDDLMNCFSEEELTFIEQNVGKFSRILSSDGDKYGENDYLDIGSTTYYLIDGRQVSNIQEKVASLKSKSQVVSADAVDNIMDDLGAYANTQGAVEMLSGLVPILNIALGFISVLIIGMMAIYTGFDVAYMAFPVFRNTCQEAKMTGQGPMAGKTSNGGTKIRFVSDDAQRAVAISETNEGAGTPWGIYLKNRLVAYIMVAIILYIFLTGQISIITDIALKMVGGIMSVLASLGG